MKVIYLDKPTAIGAQPSTSYVYEGFRDALVISTNHKRLANGAWDGGSDFYCYKTKLSHGDKLVLPNVQRNSLTPTTYVVKGVSTAPVRPTAPGVQFWPAWDGNDGVRADAARHYATGYARTRPGNPEASLAQFLMELRSDGLPGIPGKSLLKRVPFQRVPREAQMQNEYFVKLQRTANVPDRAFSQKLGGEYLNLVFGWRPFVRDLRDMYNLWHDIDRQLAKLIRENGRYVRRKATVLDDTSTTVEVPPYEYGFPYLNCYGAPPNWMSGKTVYTRTRTTKTRVWFSGSYRYYIPDVSSSQWTKRAVASLFGGIPTPELMWELMPYSWLIDWFGNVGDVVSNMSLNAVDNLTLRYSFIMKRIRTWIEHTSVVNHSGQTAKPTDFFKNNWPAADHVFRSIEYIDQKVRVGGGNPFGLDVGLTSLDAGQLAILAALGISRSKVQ